MKSLTSCLLVLAAACSLVTPVAAQTQSGLPPPRNERPYRGLFGSGVADVQQLLSATLSVGSGWSDNVLAESGGGSGILVPGDTRKSLSGTYASLSGGLNYSLNLTRVSVGASLVGSTRYYSGSVNEFSNAYGGAVGTTLRLSKRASVTASQAMSYQPFLQSVLFPRVFESELGVATIPSFDLVTARQEYLSYSSTAALSHSIARRGSLSVDYTRHWSDFRSSEVNGNGLTTQSARLRYTHGLAKGVSLRLGYGISEGQMLQIPGPGSTTTRWTQVDGGLDYSRSLSFSRKTTFSFSTGSTAVSDVDHHTHFYLNGDARLNHEIGRTWNAALAYARGIGFVETIRAPYISDSINVSVTGLINRRVWVESAIGSSIGRSVGSSSDASSFATHYATTSCSVGLTRNIALGTEYIYYRYGFDSGVPLPENMFRKMDRHGVRAYLSLWAPLFQRMRRPDAAR